MSFLSTWLGSKNEEKVEEVEENVAAVSNCTIPPNLGMSGLAAQLGAMHQQMHVGSLSIPDPLNAEERKELEELTKLHEAETKRLKLEHFKKLPPSLRQRAVDSLLWKRTVDDINGTEAPKSARQLELEQKNWQQTLSSYISSSGASIGGIRYPYEQTPEFPLPNGLTADDLVQAHNDACMEEAIRENDE